MTATYPDEKMIVDILTEAARRAGRDSSSRHPVDIACAMSFAVEYGAEMLALLHERKMLNDVPRTRA